MIDRHDLHITNSVPGDLHQWLLAYGGSTPYSEPMWRIVLAQDVYWKLADDFKVWDKNIPILERQGINLETGAQFNNKPLRVESGIQERRKYPAFQGWIVQKWFPATSYPKDQWFDPKRCMADGTPKLGPYPQFGDYEMIFGPYQDIPSRDQLITWISSYWRNREAQSESVEQRMLEQQNIAEEIEKQYYNQLLTFVDDYQRDKSVLKSSSLEAGRIRTENAKKCGITEHVGS